MTEIARVFTKLLGGLALVVVACIAGTAVSVLVAPAPASAQWGCGRCYDTGKNHHWAVAGWRIFGASEGHGWHWGRRQGVCLLDHGVCIAMPASGPTLLMEVATAALDGDVKKLADFASRPSVRVTHKRRALQIVGCGDLIVGHVPIAPELWDAVAAVANNSEWGRAS